jgi:DNA-binding response OmpR family regulator
MTMKNILLFDPDKETETLFSGWLSDAGCTVSSADSLEEIPHLLAENQFDILIMDIDFPESADSSLKLCATLRSDPRLSDLPITVLTCKRDIRKIARSIEAGIDNFILKPFNEDFFLVRLDTIFDEYKLRPKGKKVLDLNYVDYLLELASQTNREDFFTLSPVIFNVLIMDKVKTTLGEPVINVMAKRLDELIGGDYEFIKHVRFSDSHINMEEVEHASKEVPVEKLVMAFRDYIYAFLHLTRTLTSDILVERKANLK